MLGWLAKKACQTEIVKQKQELLLHALNYMDTLHPAPSTDRSAVLRIRSVCAHLTTFCNWVNCTLARFDSLVQQREGGSRERARRCKTGSLGLYVDVLNGNSHQKPLICCPFVFKCAICQEYVDLMSSFESSYVSPLLGHSLLF